MAEPAGGLTTTVLTRLSATYGPVRDPDRAVTMAGHLDFFVCKAIGWALRAYARTEPDRVRHFVTANRSRLAPCRSAKR